MGVDLILKDLFLLYSVCLTPRGPAGFKVAYSLATVLGPALPNQIWDLDGHLTSRIYS